MDRKIVKRGSTQKMPQAKPSAGGRTFGTHTRGIEQVLTMACLGGSAACSRSNLWHVYWRRRTTTHCGSGMPRSAASCSAALVPSSTRCSKRSRACLTLGGGPASRSSRGGGRRATCKRIHLPRFLSQTSVGICASYLHELHEFQCLVHHGRPPKASKLSSKRML